MKYWCNNCRLAFESEEERCPECLRQSSVVPESTRRPPARTFDPVAFVVACLILVPYTVLNWMSWHLPWWVTFPVALAGFGAGALVARAVRRPR
jgi:hypothetical protein